MCNDTAWRRAAGAAVLSGACPAPCCAPAPCSNATALPSHGPPVRAASSVGQGPPLAPLGSGGGQASTSGCSGKKGSGNGTYKARFIFGCCIVSLSPVKTLVTPSCTFGENLPGPSLSQIALIQRPGLWPKRSAVGFQATHGLLLSRRRRSDLPKARCDLLPGTWRRSSRRATGIFLFRRPH